MLHIYIYDISNLRVKQLLFPQISLIANGDEMCFCDYGTEFSNFRFISTHLLLAAVGRTNDEVA